MIDFFKSLFSADFMPHGFCYRWDPPTLWLNVVSDVVIASAYYAIPFLLFWFAKRRRDLTFQWIFVAFGLFILACGSTHLLAAVTAWTPIYRFEGVIKAITAISSVATFLLVIPWMPALIAMPSPSQLARMNRSLEEEIAVRRTAEDEVRRVNEQLELRVSHRTAELARSESRFRQLADAVPQIIWVTSPDGQIQYMNRQWHQFTGSADLEDHWQFVHPEDRPAAQERWERSLQTGEAFEVEYRLLRGDGQYRWFLVRSTPAYDADHGIAQWFGTCTDIDDQKRAARSLELALDDRQREMERRRQAEDQLLQSQKMEAIGRLAGGVAHDFNNLLTAILGYSEMALGRLGQDPEACSYIEEVRRAGERAAALTNQLLAFSRRQVATPRVFDINEAVHNTERMLRRIIGEDIVLETRCDPQLFPTKIDPVQMDQVIMNLAVNSRDAMPSGGKLTIETANVILGDEHSASHLGLAPGKYVMLAMSDTGTGMDETTRSRIFEPFFTTKEKGKGTGLGLSIVYGIMKQNGGEVFVYSEPQHGSVFKIYLPPAFEDADFGRPTELKPVPRGDETILLVEDEEQVRRLVRKMLERAGYRVLEADSGDAAIRLADELSQRIDLLLTDIVMPRMSGEELATHLRTRQPNLRVLFMSGYTDTGIVQRGLLQEGVPYLQKPFSSAALWRQIRELLD